MSTPRVVVAGAGPVGLAFACACRGFEVHVIDAAPTPPPPPDDYDTRVFALSPGTRRFLRDIGAWDELDTARLAPVRRMEIFGDAGGRMAFGGRAGSALAWIVEAARLSQVLEAQAVAAGVQLHRGIAAVDYTANAGQARATLADGAQLEGELLVGADGADSRVRALLGLDAESVDYDEEAIVANFECELPHADTARQWFGAEGVLAWLPLPGQRISIVWSARRATAAQLAGMDERDFERRVREAGNAVLGDLRLVSPRVRFPLRMVRVDRIAVPGATLIGDAAHAVHPLAGQGANLGFQDARLLAEELASRSPLERPGDLRVLRRYARGRREDVTAMQFVTDQLDALFASGRPFVGELRNAGLGMVQSQPWLKALLRERAMR